MLKNVIFTLALAFMLTGCPATGGEGASGSSPLAFLPFILIFILFYLLILRPQQKQNKKRNQMLKELKRGNDVITTGGVYGKILSISEDDVISLEVNKGITIRVSRSAVASLQSPGKEGVDKDRFKK